MAVAPKPPSFSTSPDSPFPDGYDLQGEQKALLDLLQADNPDTTDPRWSRFIELENRQRSLKQMQSDYKNRLGADRLVTNREADGLKYMGTLVDDEQDTMTLHTKEAYRLFMGRSRDASGQQNPIVGGRRVASSLRSSWVLSGKDNPYAAWVLVSFMDRMDSVKASLEKTIEEYEGALKILRTRGLNYSVLCSREPKDVDLGFRSPYGYSVAELIVLYDYFVRLVKTLIRKDRLSDDEGRIVMRQRVREIRSMFEQPPKYERYLMRDELRQLCRADWLTDASADSKKRVEAVLKLFGEVPRAVFTGQIAPRHSQRRANVSEQEMRLLQEVALSPIVQDTSDDGESGLLE